MSVLTDITKGIKTFKLGGIHPPELKELTAGAAIERFPTPRTVNIPLAQHIGAPAEAIVKRGEEVKKGQMIAKAPSFVSAPVHASVSGKVAKIDNFPHPNGTQDQMISIQSDGQDEWLEGLNPEAPLPNLDASKGKEYLEAVKNAGIVGLGGAAFPSHVKLSPPEDKPIDMLLINGAECEPYLTSDYRVMLENPQEVLYGARAFMIILGVEKCIIAIEDNKPEAIEAMREAIDNEADPFQGIGDIGVAVCQTKYPQGGEKQLIAAVLGREVPSGGLPMDVGLVVQNIGTCVAASNAVGRGIPLIERVVTVAGRKVPNPKNLLVPVGTLFSELLDYCGYEAVEGSKVLMGGPMMGKAQRTTEVPVIKGTSGIVVLEPDEMAHFEERPCLRCGRCVEVCPMGLMPSRLANFSEHDVIEPLSELGINDCVECGSCAYICPAQRHLVQWIRMGKVKVRQAEKR
ncbi:MAG: electron transport complex subunit RsxC [Candidatus Sumerlaeota bacterium]